MVKTYLFLAGAVFFEVAGTMLLPVTQNFTKLIPTTALAFFYLCAFYLLTFVADKIPPTIDDPAILTEIKEDLIKHKILNNG